MKATAIPKKAEKLAFGTARKPPRLNDRKRGSMYKHLCLIFSLFLGNVSYAQIVEAPHFADVVPYAAADTLVVLDIDDTLLVPAQMLGCDEWFCYRLEKHQKEGSSVEDALEKTLAAWEAVRHLTKMEIVEPQSDKIIHDLQQKGCSIIGLTTQGLALATRTSQQLAENDINLTLTAPYKDDQYFQLNNHGILYRNGILFTSGAPKGKALFILCDRIQFHPKRIVFVNDKAKHLVDVETTAQERGVEFIGLRYGYSDARKKVFSVEIAEYQFTHSSFHHILSNEEASRLIKKAQISNKFLKCAMDRKNPAHHRHLCR
jgi:hypothetical protein